ncbi:hypothetical protein CDAR_412851 [Caerostris darwini]|uniref:Uncharacterized protein n=1 Tax=Caerostris darwini TaxID=1538125 RepID=A0AAV4SE31_9ARAC|nr:hypothetical protein CDAR_412851 [Caerostris darwini]
MNAVRAERADVRSWGGTSPNSEEEEKVSRIVCLQNEKGGGGRAKRWPMERERDSQFEELNLICMLS